MLIRTFVEMGSLVQAKKISGGIYPMIHVYGRGDHFGHVTQMPGIPFVPLHLKFGLIRHADLEENLFEMVDGRTDGRRRTPDHGYTINSHGEPVQMS